MWNDATVRVQNEPVKLAKRKSIFFKYCTSFRSRGFLPSYNWYYFESSYVTFTQMTNEYAIYSNEMEQTTMDAMKTWTFTFMLWDDKLKPIYRWHRFICWSAKLWLGCSIGISLLIFLLRLVVQANEIAVRQQPCYFYMHCVWYPTKKRENCVCVK